MNKTNVLACIVILMITMATFCKSQSESESESETESSGGSSIGDTILKHTQDLLKDLFTQNILSKRVIHSFVIELH